MKDYTEYNKKFEAPKNPPTDCTDYNQARCPNMKGRENDYSMDYEHYECKVCGRFYKLDYDEMR